MQEPSDNHRNTIEEPLTRKEEYKNVIMKENLLPHLAETCKAPEGLEDWKKTMISLGWTQEEFEKAWNKFLLEPEGKIKNVRKWLETVMQSIRDSEIKTEHLQKIADNKNEVQAVAVETSRREKEKIKELEANRIQDNKNFMLKIDGMGIGKGNYQLAERHVKLIGGKWLYGFCFPFSENNFKTTIIEHLGLDIKDFNELN